MALELNRYLQPKKLLSTLFVVTLAVYLISLKTNFNVGLAVAGLALLLYFPGKFFLELWPVFGFSFGRLGRFGLGVAYSFCYGAVVGLVIQNSYGFNTQYQIWALLLTNIILWLAYKLLVPKKFWQDISIFHSGKGQDYSVGWQDYVPLLVMALAILGLILINPIAQNADNYQVLLKRSVIENVNQLTSRQIFGAFTALVGKFTAIDASFIYRNLYVAGFFLLSFPFYDYLRRNINSRYLASLLYLSLLSPAVILTEVNIVRPQVAMLALTIPVVVLVVESIKKKDIFASVVALLISVVTIKFHELGAVLILIAATAVIINTLRAKVIGKKVTRQQLFWLIATVLPYIWLFHLLGFFNQVLTMINYAAHFLGQVSWRWWFIDSYTTVDGASLGWQGINALFYYLYNGILLVPLLAYLCYRLNKNRLKVGLPMLPVAIYVSVFFIFAELLPRMGVFFLPNRAWVHLMIALIIWLGLVVEKLKGNQLTERILPVILSILIVFGYSGSLYVAKNNINQVDKQELPVADFIRNNTPSNSIVLSSQGNLTLVDIYGQRAYSRIYFSEVVDRGEFDAQVQNELQDLSVDKLIVIKPKIIQVTETPDGNEVVTIQEQQTRLNKATYHGGNPVYFLYSYRKLKGLIAERDYSKDIIDSANKDTYSRLGYPIVFSNNGTILLRIR